VIPEHIIDRPPSAELRPDQTDQDSLPPYAVLDGIVERYMKQDMAPRDIVAQGFDAAVVRQVVRLIDRSEYKRRQSAPGVRITERGFGRDRRYPITFRYQAPF
jgi:NAD+ synthase (glutamine-hydrolysing)